MIAKVMVNLVKSSIGQFLSFIGCLVSLALRPKRAAIPPITDEILLIPATELSEKIKSGQLSCEHVVKSYM